MKKWIVKQFISFAEVFGWKIPVWIQRLVPADELKALVARERALTDALRQAQPDELQAPANLEYIIESRIKANARVLNRPKRVLDYLVPVTGIAALVVVGIFVIDGRHAEQSPQVDEVAASVPQSVVLPMVEVPAHAVSEIAGLGEKGSNLLVRPLAAEKARLTSDVTSALRYVARGIVPNQYMEKVNSRLDSFEQEYGSSI